MVCLFSFASGVEFVRSCMSKCIRRQMRHVFFIFGASGVEFVIWCTLGCQASNSSSVACLWLIYQMSVLMITPVVLVLALLELVVVLCFLSRFAVICGRATLTSQHLDIWGLQCLFGIRQLRSMWLLMFPASGTSTVAYSMDNSFRKMPPNLRCDTGSLRIWTCSKSHVKLSCPTSAYSGCPNSLKTTQRVNV
jgi:hypothetical protein